MEKVYRIKVSLCLLVLTIVSMLCLSCSLFSFDDYASISFSLPRTITTNSRANPTDTPSEYNVILLSGTIDNPTGKAFEKAFNAGDTVTINKLLIGNYTLIVQGETDYLVYNGTKEIKVQNGSNRESISLTSSPKAKLVLDLSSISKFSNDTFSYNIKDLDGRVIVEENNVQYVARYNVPKGLKKGSYTLSFNNNSKPEAKFLANDSDHLFITDLELASPLTLKVVKTNLDISVSLDKVPELQRYTCGVYDTADTLLYSFTLKEQEQLINYNFTNNENYRIKIFDSSNYNDLLVMENFTADADKKVNVVINTDFYVSAAGNDSYNGTSEASSFRNIQKAIDTINTRCQASTIYPTFNIHLVPSGDLNVDNILIDTPLKLNISGKGSTVNLIAANSTNPFITVNNENANVVLDNLSFKEITNVTVMQKKGFLNVTKGKCILKPNVKVEAGTSADTFIKIGTGATVKMDKLIHYVSSASIYISQGANFIISEDFYNKDIDGKCSKINLEIDPSYGSNPVIQTENNVRLGNVSLLFDIKEKSDKCIDPTGRVSPKKTININFTDSEGTQNPSIIGGDYEYIIDKLFLDENDFAMSIGDFKVPFSIEYHALFSLSIRKKTSSTPQVVYTQTFDPSTITQIDIPLYKLYVSDEAKKGKAVLTNNGYSPEKPITFDNALNIVKASGELPSKIFIVDNQINGYEGKPTTKQAVVLDQPMNLTITSYTTTSDQSIKRLESHMDSSATNSIPLFIMSHANANVTLDNVELRIRADLPPRSGGILVNNGTLVIKPNATVNGAAAYTSTIAVMPDGKVKFGGTRESGIYLISLLEDNKRWGSVTVTEPITYEKFPDWPFKLTMCDSSGNYVFTEGVQVINVENTAVMATEAAKIKLSDKSFSEPADFQISAEGKIIRK